MVVSKRPKPKKKIVIVRTGEPVNNVFQRHGQFADMIQQAIDPEHDGHWDEIDARQNQFITPTHADAYVITGSSANVPKREPWMLATEAWLREVHAARVPTLGICFGHQLLAQALGGDVQRNPRGREMGNHLIERHTDDPIFEDVPQHFHANISHVDTVVRLPPGAVSLARSEREDHHVIRFSDTTYGVQYHPEFDHEVMQGYIEARHEILREEGFHVEAMIARVNEARHARRTLQNWVRRHVKHRP